MKIFVLSISLFYCIVSKGQYQSFIQDNAVWTIKEDDLVNTLWVDNYYGYYMNGDTIIKGNQYKKNL